MKPYQSNSIQAQSNTFNGIGDLDQLIGALTQGFCDFTKCTVECEARAVSQQCGQEAANLINGFVARSINSVQKVTFSTHYSFSYTRIRLTHELLKDVASIVSAHDSDE